MAEDEDDETLIAARMPGGMPPSHSFDNDEIPEDEATLLAIPRSAFPPPRPAAGLPPALPPPRPAAGLPPATPPPPRPAAGMPPAGPGGFVPVHSTVQMPKVTPLITMGGGAPPPPAPPPMATAPMAPLPMAAPPPAAIPLPVAPPPVVIAQAVITQPIAAPRPPPPSSPTAVSIRRADLLEPAHEGMPPVVVRVLLVCGLLTVLGLSALIYLQL